MRKHWMKCIGQILCLVLCLSGCSVAPDERVAMGRYLEAPVNLPVGGSLSFSQAEGTTFLVDSSGTMLYESSDLINWEMVATSHNESVAPALNGVTSLVVGKDGALYLSGWAMVDDNGHTFVERIIDGKSERLQLDQTLGTNSDRLALYVLPSGDLLGLGEAGVYRFSPSGTTKQKYDVSDGESMAVYGSELAVCSPRDNLITVLDIETGQMLRTLPLPSAARYGVVSYDKNGFLYYACPNGLYSVNPGGTLILESIDARLSMLGKPSAQASQIMFDSENNPLIAYSQDGNTMLIQYHYDENVPTEPGTVLSVYTLFDSPTLRECASKFQQQYPDVLVDIYVALPEYSAINPDDEIRTLNTEVSTGNGPDVLVLDGLPIRSYVEEDMLLDLSAVVQPMIDANMLLGNVVSAFKMDSAIPAVPTRFLMPSIWGDVEGLDTLEDMEVWAKANPDSLPYYAVDVEPLIRTFYPSSAPAWYTEDGLLDEAKIEAFLTALKAIRGHWSYDTMVAKTGWDIKHRYMQQGDTFTWSMDTGQQMLGSVTREESDGRDFLHNGIQKQLPYLLRGVDSAAWPNGAMVSQKNGNIAPLPGQAEGCFVPTLVLGAIKGSKRSEVALKFITFALGEESQNTDLEEGFQVNVKALDAAQARGRTMFEAASISEAGNGTEDIWSTVWPNQRQQQQLRLMIEALKRPVVPDFALYQIIVQESEPFFEGRLDAKQTAANVCASGNSYLSEHGENGST